MNQDEEWIEDKLNDFFCCVDEATLDQCVKYIEAKLSNKQAPEYLKWLRYENFSGALSGDKGSFEYEVYRILCSKFQRKEVFFI